MPHQICFDLTAGYTSAIYIAVAYIGSDILDRELKKGSAELLILSLVEASAVDGLRGGESMIRVEGGSRKSRMRKRTNVRSMTRLSLRRRV